MTEDAPTILLVEDNPADVRLTQEVLRDAGIPLVVHVARDGEAALAFLRRQGEHGAAPRPDLVLLDLNLPRTDGREVLAAMKGDTALRRIPVIVLTTSAAPADVAGAYDLHANAYVTKPVDLKEFTRMMQSLVGFWCAVARLPEA